LGDITACINKALEANKLTKKEAEAFTSLSNKVGVENAIAESVDIISQQKRETVITSLRIAQGDEAAKKHGKGYAVGLMSIMVRDIWGASKSFNVDGLSRDLKGAYHSQVAEILEAFRTKTFGFTQDKRGLQQFVKAVYGEKSDGEVAKFARQYTGLLERMRKDFNDAGGVINLKEDYHLPQSHNRRLVEEAGEDEWIGFITPLLDDVKMSSLVGEDGDIDAALRYAYKTISTDGLNKVKDLEIMPKGLGRVMSRKHSDARFLHFKDADSWIAYNEQFGNGDIFSTVTSDIENMAGDTALMRVFGANPEASFQTLLRQAKKEGASEAQINRLQSQWNVISGAVNNKVVTTAADVSQGTRNAITASTLGSAMLSAISDTSFTALTASYRGLSTSQAYKNSVALLNPANKEDRIFAVQMGLTADAMIGAATGANRFGETYGIGRTAKVSEAVMRFSGLTAWTDAGRKGFGMEYSAALAKQSNNTWGELNPRFRKGLEDYNINQAEWDVFRKKAKLTHKGAKFADLSKDDSGKFLNMVLTETDFAVPSPDARTRMYQTGGYEAGTTAGEATRFLMSLKSFPLTLVNTHLMRAATQNSMSDRLAYGGGLLLSTAIMGGVAMQVKDIASGREPRPIGDNPQDMAKFGAAALQQGGGLGLMGDLIFSDANRFGGGLAQTLAGPSVELLDKSWKLSVGNLQQLAKDEETDFTRELVDYGKRYTPKTWQFRLLVDSMYDQAAIMADPKARSRFKRSMRNREADYGQGYWWKKGELLPEAIQ